jgi:hypothetical protein
LCSCRGGVKIKINRNGDVYTTELKEGFSSLFTDGVVGDFYNYLSLKNIATGERIDPIGLNGAEKTDYGLIYNTDGSLCATTLPECGVAVEEGTENLITNFNPTLSTDGTGAVITHSDYKTVVDLRNWTGATYGYLRFKGGTASPGIPYSFSTTQESGILAQYRMGKDTPPEHVAGFSTKIGRTEVTRTFTTEAGTLFIDYVFFPNTHAGQVLVFKYPQIERNSFSTSFTEGTRLPGALDIPTNISLLESGTIAFTVWTPKAMEDRTGYYDGAVVNVCQGTVRQLDLGMGTSGLNLAILGASVRTLPYEPGNKYLCVLTWENGGNPRFYLNGNPEYSGTQTFADAGNGIIQLGRQLTTRVNTVRYQNLRICPYAVSPETVKAWHSTKLKSYRAGNLYVAGEIIEGHTSNRLTRDGNLEIKGEVIE